MMAPNTTLPSASFAFVVLVRIALHFYAYRSSWVLRSEQEGAQATTARSDYSRVARVCLAVFLLCLVPSMGVTCRYGITQARKTCYIVSRRTSSLVYS